MSNIQNLYAWANDARLSLLKSESKNIIARGNACEVLINKVTETINEKLGIKHKIPLFRYDINPNEHLSYIINWNGLKIVQVNYNKRSIKLFFKLNKKKKKRQKQFQHQEKITNVGQVIG